jgi:hypothetical protein
VTNNRKTGRRTDSQPYCRGQSRSGIGLRVRGWVSRLERWTALQAYVRLCRCGCMCVFVLLANENIHVVKELHWSCESGVCVLC